MYYIIFHLLLARFRLYRTAGDHGFAAAQKAFPIQHDDPAAAAAADLDVRAGADDGPFAGTAGMGFAGGDHVSDKNLFYHNISSIHHYIMFRTQ